MNLSSSEWRLALEAVSASTMQAWTLNEWLYYLEHRHASEVQLRLVNAYDVALVMGLLKWSIPVITVGGTNGKGSTVAALSAIYSAAGYRVGQFTSPHLLTFNERICINQQPISDDDLCLAFSCVEEQRKTIPLTYFEMSLLAALLYFKQANLDVIILEVGVGGRLDATNIIDADLAIITTVDLDHQDYLGHDRDSIGFEKAGILRANQPFIYADTNPPLTVLSQAQSLHTSMMRLGVDYDYYCMEQKLYITRPNREPIVLPIPKLHLNAAVAAVMATERLHKRLPVLLEDWSTAINNVTILGRQQWIPGDVSVLFDVAHNPQAAGLLAQQVAHYKPGKKVHAVFSALKDKDICGLIYPLSSFVDQWYPACLSGKRATERAELLTAFESVLGVRPKSYEDPVSAYQAAMQVAGPGDIVLVYGSFLLVGAVMNFVRNADLSQENNDEIGIK